MITKSMCGWCHEFVDSREKSCPNCGHDAHCSRLDCRCLRCTSYVPQPLTAAEVDDLERELLKRKRPS